MHTAIAQSPTSGNNCAFLKIVPQSGEVFSFYPPTPEISRNRVRCFKSESNEKGEESHVLKTDFYDCLGIAQDTLEQ